MKTRPFRDNEDIVEGLSRLRGRLGCVVRKGRARSSLLEAPSLVRARFRAGSRLDTISQPEMLSAFPALRLDLERLLTAGFLGRLFLGCLPEREPFEEAFELLSGLFGALEAQVCPRVCGLWGQDRLLMVLGLSPEVQACVKCGSISVQGFSACDGGLLCGGCYSGEGFAISESALTLVRGIREAGLGEVALAANDAVASVGRIYREQFLTHLDVSPSLFRRVLPPLGKDEVL